MLWPVARSGGSSREIPDPPLSWIQQKETTSNQSKECWNRGWPRKEFAKYSVRWNGSRIRALDSGARDYMSLNGLAKFLLNFDFKRVIDDRSRLHRKQDRYTTEIYMVYVERYGKRTLFTLLHFILLRLISTAEASSLRYSQTCQS